MPNWATVLTNELLEEAGKDCSTTRELAHKVGNSLKEEVTVDSLFNAHKRHKDRLELRGSLTDYMGKVDEEPVKGLHYIRWKLSDEVLSEIEESEVFIVTSATNNCDLHQGFMKAIDRYRKKNKACLLIIPQRYKNPTNRVDGQIIDEDAWWPTEIHGRLTDDLVKLHDYLWLMAHVRIQTTAVNPLTGLEAFSEGASAIYGHPQVAMKTVPTPQNKLPKLMYTTGSCSMARYSETKAGIKGEFHHTIGALIVEKSGDKFFIRNVAADESGGFYDLNHYYGPEKIEKCRNTLALITGDEHVMFNDKANREATYTSKNSIVNTLRPEKIVRHDVFDGYSISHHNRKDPIIQYSKHKNGHHLVQSELELTVRHIEETTPKFSENIIVASNHHEHLLRWLKESHPASEPWNADVWLEIWGLLKETLEFKERGVVYRDPFALWMESRVSVKTRFLDRDAEDSIGGVMIGFHGDQGANGARGSIHQYSKIGAKTVIGHSHSPGIRHSTFQVGTSSSLRLEYTNGPSSWAHCHCVIYPNGKRQLIFVINGEWRKG